jgi:hypothetical protein
MEYRLIEIPLWSPSETEWLSRFKDDLDRIASRMVAVQEVT